MSYHEVEAFLNEEPFNYPQRREHHLPPGEYARPDAAFFVTLCARHHGEPFRDCTLAATILEAVNHRSTCKVWIVYAYCLMPDHLHLVMQLLPPKPEQAPRKDLLRVLAEFKSFTTRRAWALGLQGRLWQHDQYDRLVRDDREFDIRCRYVLDNPVRRAWWSGPSGPTPAFLKTGKKSPRRQQGRTEPRCGKHVRRGSGPACPATGNAPDTATR